MEGLDSSLQLQGSELESCFETGIEVPGSCADQAVFFLSLFQPQDEIEVEDGFKQYDGKALLQCFQSVTQKLEYFDALCALFLY